MVKEKSCFLLYIVIIIIVFICTFEFLILPWHYQLPRDLALIGFTAKPNIIIDDTTINEMGFTGDEIHLKKDSNKKRILTLGGSAIFNRRMTERLIKALNSVSSHPVEVLGSALRTHTSMSSVIKYSTLSKYHFDYVLIYHGINDLFVNHVKPEYFKSDFSHMLPWYKRNILLNNSLIARTIYNNFIWGKKVFGMQKVWYIYPAEEIENANNYISEQLFKRNIMRLIEEIRQNDGVPVLMTYAWNIPDNYNQESFQSGNIGYEPSDFRRYPIELWGSVRYVKEGLQRHNLVIREVAKRNNVLLIDQEKLMGKELRWFEDVCHFSEEGTDKFIQNIVGFFVEQSIL